MIEDVIIQIWRRLSESWGIEYMYKRKNSLGIQVGWLYMCAVRTLEAHVEHTVGNLGLHHPRKRTELGYSCLCGGWLIETHDSKAEGNASHCISVCS